MTLSMLPAWPIADQVTQLVVDHVVAEVLLEVGEHLAGPALEELDVLWDAADELADLLEDQGVEEQGEEQDRGEQADDDQQRKAMPRLRPRRVSRVVGGSSIVGNAGCGNEGARTDWKSCRASQATMRRPGCRGRRAGLGWLGRGCGAACRRTRHARRCDGSGGGVASTGGGCPSRCVIGGGP